MSYPATIGPFVSATPVEETPFPVSSSDFKNFHEIDFDDHDLFIGRVINAAVFRVELYTGCSLVAKTLSVRYESLSGEALELPRGPVTSTPVIKIKGEVVSADSYTLSGGDFPILEMESSVPVEITYETGYTTQTIPESLKTAVLWQAWEQFMQKTGKVKTNWKAQAVEYRRPSLCL